MRRDSRPPRFPRLFRLTRAIRSLSTSFNPIHLENLQFQDMASISNTPSSLTSHQQRNLSNARALLEAIQASTGPDATEAQIDAMLSYYSPNITQEEFPNRLVPNGATRKLKELREGAIKGRAVLLGQSYHVEQAHASGDSVVVVEAVWTGNLAIPIGQLKKGDAMKAKFCVVLEFDDEGKIVKQRNYDCFEAF